MGGKFPIKRNSLDRKSEYILLDRFSSIHPPPPHKLVKISQYPIRKMSLRRYFNKYRDGRGFSLEIEGGLGKSGDGRGSKNFPSEKIADIAFAQHLEERTKRDERIKKPFSIPSALPITLLSLPFTFSFFPISAY